MNDKTFVDGFYHVFLREKDPNCLRGEYISDGMQLIKTFFSQQKAAEWIVKHGRDIIIEEEEENRGRPCVLTIIFFSDDERNHEIDENPSQHTFISIQAYPTFSFTDAGRKMLFEEIKYHLGMTYLDSHPIPYWLYHIDDNGNISHGFTLKQHEKIEICMRLDTNQQAVRMGYITEFLLNPNKILEDFNMPLV